MTNQARAALQVGKGHEGNRQKTIGKVCHCPAALIWLS